MVVDYLLFRHEVPLGDEIVGDPAFQASFTRDKRTATNGGSLKDLRLKGRLFEHRCSYMIYSPTFTALPPMLKRSVYRRLNQILGAADPVAGFEYLEAEERVRILQILRETLPDFPAS